MPNLKVTIAGFVASCSVFLTCCIVMLYFRNLVSQSPLLESYIVVWGISALVFPFFLVRLFILLWRRA